jgi:hypothetical protein
MLAGLASVCLRQIHVQSDGARRWQTRWCRGKFSPNFGQVPPPCSAAFSTLLVYAAKKASARTVAGSLAAVTSASQLLL